MIIHRMEACLVVVVVWLGQMLLRPIDSVDGFFIPIRPATPVVSHPIAIPIVLQKKRRRRRRRDVTAVSRDEVQKSMFMTNRNDQGNDEIDEGDKSPPSIVSYNDFDDFEWTPGTSSDPSSVTELYNDFDDQSLIGMENDDIPLVTPRMNGIYNNNKPSSNSDDGKDDAMLLSQRMSVLQREEQRRVAVCDRNWKLGNWFVRGFSLEEMTNTTPTTSDDDDEAPWSASDIPIPSVSTIVTSSPFADMYNDENDNDDMDLGTFPNQIDVWVGRTDGSVFGIRFGTDYWTRLGSSDVAAEDAFGRERDVVRSPFNDENDVPDGHDEVASNNTPTEQNPFMIVTQFQCTGTSPITSMVALPSLATTTDSTNDDDDDDDRVFIESDIYVACKDSMIIEHWHYDGHGVSCINSLIDTQGCDSEASSVLTLRLIHTTVNKVPTTMILSASDGSITLWDIKTDTVAGFINSIQIPNIPGDPESYEAQTIVCIDTDHEFVYIGTDSGYVLVYAINDILLNNDPPSVTISAVGCWRAAPTDDCSITAMKCGGPGTLGRNSASTTSSILYTGDAQGLVKQWEVLKMVIDSPITSDDNEYNNNGKKKYKVEAWPKLSTQRLPKKAHMFTGHQGAITGLLSIDALKFVSASADGTVRAWNTASGKELFRMDGFPDPIRSLCLLDGGITDESTDRLRNTILVTDGMDKYVCVHDFSADDEDTADYDLEMPEYIS